jgi:hypothetical protein
MEGLFLRASQVIKSNAVRRKKRENGFCVMIAVLQVSVNTAEASVCWFQNLRGYQSIKSGSRTVRCAVYNRGV